MTQSELPYEINTGNSLKQPTEGNILMADSDNSLTRSYYQGVIKDPFYNTLQTKSEPIYEKPVGQHLM